MIFTKESYKFFSNYSIKTLIYLKHELKKRKCKIKKLYEN